MVIIGKGVTPHDHTYHVNRISKKTLLPYMDKEHEKYPHVVRFSGGRSSAMMTLLLCEKNLLKQERGDVIVFSNTSAEHPQTYKFAKKCKKYIEENYGIPFFWVEYCTYEDSFKGNYKRYEGYKLVNPVSIEKSKKGYRWKGEAFREMVSHAGMLPSSHLRSCTSRLKLQTTHAFLSEWFAGKSENGRLGHHQDRPHLTLKKVYETYAKRGGEMSRQQYMNYKKYSVKECPTYREPQKWADYTKAQAEYSNPLLEKTYSRKADIWGLGATKYLSLLGIRADEDKRVSRILSRTMFANGATTAKCRIKTQPPFEFPYFPLHSSGITKDGVLGFWEGKDFNLKLDDRLGNCTFCFMKGDRALPQLANLKNSGKVENTPSDFKWWVGFEQEYKRVVPSRNGKGKVTFGLNGKRGPFYNELLTVSEAQGNKPIAVQQVSCDCTD